MKPDPRFKRPMTPGRFLQERILAPEKITQEALSVAMGVNKHTVRGLVAGSKITVEMALRLEAATRVSAEMWLNLQRNYEMMRARALMAETLAKIKPITKNRDFVDVSEADVIRGFSDAARG